MKTLHDKYQEMPLSKLSDTIERQKAEIKLHQRDLEMMMDVYVERYVSESNNQWVEQVERKK